MKEKQRKDRERIEKNEKIIAKLEKQIQESSIAFDEKEKELMLLRKERLEAENKNLKYAETENEQMSELKRFYVEKFEGNVLREFYPEGALKSEAEVKEGKRHGRYREYYEDGTLKLRGKYVNNKPKGTWKYYTEDGKFERKEKF